MRFLRTKKKFKKVCKKFGKKKKGITFAAPKNETGTDSRASGGRSEGEKRKDIEKGRKS